MSLIQALSTAMSGLTAAQQLNIDIGEQRTVDRGAMQLARRQIDGKAAA